MDYENYRGFNLNETVFPVNDYGFKVTRWFWREQNRFKSYQLTAGIVDDLLDSGNKENLPQVDFTSNKEFHCVIADFDQLPRGFASFTQFHRYLHNKYVSGCCVRSVSGKVKLIFLVENVLHIDHLATLRSIIEPELHEYLDTSKTALTQTYLNTDMIVKIQTWLKTAIPYEAKNLEFDEICCQDLAEEYLDISHKLTKLLRDIGLTNKSYRSLTNDRILQLAALIVTDALSLCKDGMVWNQEIFAKMLGLKNGRTAARILDKLQEAGLIEMICNYSAGNRSRTYVAQGELLTFFKEHGLHTTEVITAESNNTIKVNRINRLISQLLPPSYNANKYYLKIAKNLTKLGLSVTLVTKVLFDIDQRRPKEKQRPRAYFNSLGKWSYRKYA